MWQHRIKSIQAFSPQELKTLPTYAVQFFFRYNFGFRLIFWMLSFAAVCSAALRFIGLYVLASVISDIQTRSFEELAYQMFPLWLGAFILAEAIDYFIRRFSEALPIVFSEYTTLRFYLTFAELRSYHLFNYSKEKLTTLIGQYTQHIRQFLSDWVWGITFKITRLTIIVVILFRQSPYVLFANMFFVFCFLMMAFRISSRFSSISKRYSEQTIETATTLASFFLNLNTLKRLQAQPLFEHTAKDFTKGNWSALDAVRRFHAWRWLLQLNLFNLLYACTLLYGIYQVKQGELQLGFLLFIKWSFDELWNILVYLIEYYVLLVQQKQDAEIVRGEFSAIINTYNKGNDRIVLNQGEFRSLRLEHIELQFTRSQESEVQIRIPHFEVKSGERVGLIGESGSGKSTLLSVLAHLMPFQGQYFINDIDCSAKTLPPAIITIINNSDPLFRLSLYDNITLGKKYSEDVLYSVLEGCLIREFASDLSVMVGDKNFHLSTGQEQRVRLARGLLQGGDVFLFDEIFNGIDDQKKDKIITFLIEYLKGKTVIFVTHNHQELRLVDTVYKAEQIITKQLQTS